MTTEIQFRDDEFSFRTAGTTFLVRTEVAEGSFARVVVSEQCEQPAMEPEGDE